MPSARISASRNVLTSVSKTIVRLGVLGVPSLSGGCIRTAVRVVLGTLSYLLDQQCPTGKRTRHHAGMADLY